MPYGDYKGIQSDFNLPLIQWSIDTEDWRYKDKPGSGRTQAQRNADMQKIISSVVDHATGGEIVLMHAEGFKFVTVHELYAIYGKTLEPGVVYFTPKR